MTTDPRIRALASEAAALIKTLTNANNAQIEAIYRDFRTQADAIQGEASTKTLAGSGADLLQADSTLSIGVIPIMTKPLGFYAGARSGHPDADILVSITEEFGSMLQELTHDDKAAVLICLVDAAVNPQQVFIQDNFFSSQNGGELWQLAQKLTPSNQLALSVAIVEQLTIGGQQ